MGGVLIVVAIGAVVVLSLIKSGLFDKDSLLGSLIAAVPTSTPTATPTATPIPVSVKGIRQLAEVATVEYWTVSEVRDENIPDDLRRHLGVKEEILLLVYIKVKAGFDLSKLGQDDVWTDGGRVQLNLPEPEVLSAEIDLDRTHIVHYQNTLLSRPNPDLERQALKKAKDAVLRAIEEGGAEGGLAGGTDTGVQPFVVDPSYMQKAREYGQVFFENYLRSLGFTDVNVVID